MSKRCTVLGVNHFLQNAGDDCISEAGKADVAEQKQAFVNFIGTLVKEIKAGLIAEEGTLDYTCAGAVVGKDLGTTYIDITMPIAEREKAGIQTPGYDLNPETREAAYRAFEEYMVGQVHRSKAAVILVICGRRHMKRIGTGLAAAGHEVKLVDIIDQGWYRGIPQEGEKGVIGHDREDEGA
jgi:hypothetical protein